MRKAVHVGVALLFCVAAERYFSRGSTGNNDNHSLLVTAASAAPADTDDPCQLPTQAPDPKDSNAVAETAWKIFVAVNCPANATQLVWETWTEQYSLYTQPGQPVGNPRRLHGSALNVILSAKSPGGAQAVELNPATGCQKLPRPPSNMPNSKTKPSFGDFCEEVHLDPTAEAYIVQHGYQFRAGQQQAVTSSATIQFPTTAVEVKADWFPVGDFSPAQFSCSNPTPGLHTEMIAGGCYALVGMHISSKLLPDWLWATFEPQNKNTNPQRCSTKLFGPCIDRFGSSPATSKGGTTQQTPALAALMKRARLAPEFSNYRLDGAQIEFGTTHKPTLLGNSIIEGETVPGLSKGQASCISCHSASIINSAGIEDPTKPVGPEPQLPTGYMRRDFVWSLGEACPGSVFNSNPNCLNTTAGPAPTQK
jgi:hypothetical protein